MSRVVFLHGPAAAGKLTIARALAGSTGALLFDNHLTVDLLCSVFAFGSPEFVKHRDRIWIGVIADAVRTGKSLLFTFCPESTVPTDFPARLEASVREAGGTLVYVRVACAEAEIRRRLGDPRRGGAKLTDPALYDRLASEGAFDYPALPADFTVDATHTPAPENAAKIAAWLAARAPQAR